MSGDDNFSFCSERKLLILKISQIIAFSSALLFVIYILCFENENPEIDSVEYDIDIVNHVNLINEDGGRSPRKLPAMINAIGNVMVEIDTSNVTDRKNQCLFLVSNFNGLVVRLDGEEVYRYDIQKNRVYRSGGYAVHMVNLDEHVRGRNLSVEYSSRHPFKSEVQLFKYKFGTRYDIISYGFFNEDWPTVVAIIALFLFFIVSFTAGVVQYRKSYYVNRVFYLSFFSLNLALYAAMQVNTLIYLLSSVHLVLYTIEYIALIVLAVPAMALMSMVLSKKYVSLFKIGIAMAFINLLVQIAYIVFSDYEFIDFHVLSVTGILLYSAIGTYAFFGTNPEENPGRNAVAVSLLPILLSAALVIFFNLLNGVAIHKEILLIGVFAFLLIQTTKTIKNAASIHKEMEEIRFLRKLAYIDLMTDMGNRASYTYYVSNVSPEDASIWAIMLDLNNLKHINDTLGHQAGDQAILFVADAIKKTIRRKIKASSFRIGGDEFIIFLERAKDYQIDSFVEELNHNLRTMDFDNLKLKPTVSIGYAYYNSMDKKYADSTRGLEDAVTQADKNMMLDKAEYKKNLGINNLTL